MWMYAGSFERWLYVVSKHIEADGVEGEFGGRDTLLLAQGWVEPCCRNTAAN